MNVMKRARIDAYEGKLADREIEVYNHNSMVQELQRKKTAELWEEEKKAETDPENVTMINTKSEHDDDEKHHHNTAMNSAINLMKENKKREAFRSKRSELLEQEKNKGNFTRSRCKIRMPDAFVIMASFGAKETVQDIYDFVKEHLVNKDREFILFETPPKRILTKKGDRLFQAKLVPSASLYFGWKDIDSTKHTDGPFLDMVKVKEFVTAW